jgi:ubiquinone/menaquinone biosynthesis C-methylase UbiE
MAERIPGWLVKNKKVAITHSYEGLGRKYFQARKGTPQFTAFMVSQAGLDKTASDTPLTIVELGVGSGQQTGFMEKQLNSSGFHRYKILAYDKSYHSDSSGEPAQLNLLMDRIKRGEISEKVIPQQLDFDGTPLPLEPESVDLCYMAWVLHHLKNQQGVLNEIARVSRKKARFFMYQVTIEDLENHPLNEFFPDKYEYDKQRYPTRAQLKHMFLEAGFTCEKPHIIKAGQDDPRIIDRSLLSDIDDTTLDSALMMIKNDAPRAFAEGIKRVTKEVEKAGSTGVYRQYERIDRTIFWGIKL